MRSGCGGPTDRGRPEQENAKRSVEAQHHRQRRLLTQKHRHGISQEQNSSPTITNTIFSTRSESSALHSESRARPADCSSSMPVPTYLHPIPSTEEHRRRSSPLSLLHIMETSAADSQYWVGLARLHHINHDQRHIVLRARSRLPAFDTGYQDVGDTSAALACRFSRRICSNRQSPNASPFAFSGSVAPSV